MHYSVHFFFFQKLFALKEHSFRTTQHNPLRSEMAQYNRKDMRGFSEKTPSSSMNKPPASIDQIISRKHITSSWTA